MHAVRGSWRLLDAIRFSQDAGRILLHLQLRAWTRRNSRVSIPLSVNFPALHEDGECTTSAGLITYSSSLPTSVRRLGVLQRGQTKRDVAVAERQDLCAFSIIWWERSIMNTGRESRCLSLIVWFITLLDNNEKWNNNGYSICSSITLHHKYAIKNSKSMKSRFLDSVIC